MTGVASAVAPKLSSDAFTDEGLVRAMYVVETIERLAELLPWLTAWAELAAGYARLPTQDASWALACCNALGVQPRVAYDRDDPRVRALRLVGLRRPVV